MKKAKLLLLCLIVAVAVSVAAACGDKKNEPPAEFTVTFETFGGGTVSPQTVKNGETATKPSDPVRVGWVFDGWQVDGTDYTFTEPVTSDITVKAAYTSVLGGEGTASSPFSIDSGDEYKLMQSYIAGGATEFINAHYAINTNDTIKIDSTISKFNGVFDGKNKTVAVAVPMFAELGGTVKNLKVCTSNSDTGMTASGVAGVLANTATESAVITDVTVDGIINVPSGFAGGVVGENAGRIEFVTAQANVSGDVAGGIAGINSGVIINSVCVGHINSEDIGGGIAGALDEGGLIQNCGYGGNIDAFNIAGGIVGSKQDGSAIYRSYVFGEHYISATAVGKIVGKLPSDIRLYEDVVNCKTDADFFAPDGITDITVTEGEMEAYIRAIDLPAWAWNTQPDGGGYPELKSAAERTAAPQTVKLNGEDVAFGSHVAPNSFSAEFFRFSTLIELDSDVTVTQCVAEGSELYGNFADGNAALEFKGGNAVYDGKTLTYEASRVNGEYTEDYYGERDYYRADLHFYTDGETQYMFAVIKESTSAGYVGYLNMFSLGALGKWAQIRQWSPKAEFAGAYVLGNANVNLHLIVDGEYRIANGAGYNQTLFYATSPEGETTLSAAGNGITALYYGYDKNATEYTPALVYIVDSEDESVDFIYAAKDGDGFVSAVYTENLDANYVADAEMYGGSWFDGENVITVDAANKKVSFNGAEAVDFTFPAGHAYINFNYSGKEYNLSVGLNAFGDTRLISIDGDSDFTAAVYDDGILGGVWVGNGKTVEITYEPALGIKVDEQAATLTARGLYNDSFMYEFTAGGIGYRLVNYLDEVAFLFVGETPYYAVNNSAISHFAGSFSTFYKGSRIDLTVKSDFTGSVKTGAAAAQNITVGLGYNEELGALIAYYTLGGNDYIFTWLDGFNLMMVTSSDDENADPEIKIFTKSTELDRYVVSGFTRGEKMLDVDGSGNYVIYDRGATDKGEAHALTAIYVERANGGSGFRLADTREENGESKTYAAFDLDADVLNYKYFAANASGDLMANCIFVPDEKMQELVGTYIFYNGYGADGKNIMKINADGTSTETYTDRDGTQVNNRKQNWYPQINYNYNTGEQSMIAVLVAESGVTGYAYLEPFGLEMIGGQVTYYFEDLYDFTVQAYKSDAAAANGGYSTLKFYEGRVKVDGKAYTITGVTRGDDGSVTMSLKYKENWAASDDTAELATVKFTAPQSSGDVPPPPPLPTRAASDVYTAVFKPDGGSAVNYTGEAVKNVRKIFGTYASESGLYTVEEYVFITATVRLTMGNSIFNYQEVFFDNEGEQVFAFSHYSNGTKYVKVSDGTMTVTDDLLGKGKITAKIIAEVKPVALTGDRYATADGSSVIEFDEVKSLFSTDFCIFIDGLQQYYYQSATITDAKYTMIFIDDFNAPKAYVRLSVDDNGAVTSFKLGATEEVAANEPVYTSVGKKVSVDVTKWNGKQFTAGNNTLEITASTYGSLVEINGGSWSEEIVKRYDYDDQVFIWGFTADEFYDSGEGDVYLFITLDADGNIATLHVATALDGAKTEYTPVAEKPTADVTKFNGKKFRLEKDGETEILTISVNSMSGSVYSSVGISYTANGGMYADWSEEIYSEYDPDAKTFVWGFEAGSSDDGDGEIYLFMTLDDSGNIATLKVATSLDGAQTEYTAVAE